MAKTQVTDESMPVSGRLGVFNQDTAANISLPTAEVSLDVGGVIFYIQDASTSSFWSSHVDYPDKEFVIVAWVGIEGPDGPDPQFWGWDYGDPGPWDVSLDYSITVSGSQRIHRDQTLTPSGDRDVAPAYAADRDIDDEWIEEGHPWSVSVSFGGSSWSGTQVYNEDVYGNWEPILSHIDAVTWNVSQHKGYEGYKYADGSINWAGVDIDLSRYVKESTYWTLDGKSNGVEFSMTQSNLGLNDGVGFTISKPRIWNFGLTYASIDRDGNPHLDYVLNGPFQASNHCSASLGWATTSDGETFGASPGDKVWPTVGELYNLGEYSDPLSVNGLDYRDPDDQYKFFTSAKMQLSLTEASVERDDLVEKYGHYSGDLEVMMRIPPLSATSCDEAPDVNGVMTVLHRTGVGVYGPSDGGERALDHDDWSADANATVPNLSGEFTVSGGDGTISLNIPSNYGSRLDAVPQENFPTEMPGYPNVYWTHQANAYREFDGEPDQSGGTHSEPLEAVYCWRGFPALDLSAWTVPADCTLTITLDVTTYTIGDEHTTDSTRQTEATNTPSSIQYTYTVQANAVGGIDHIMLGVPSEGSEPDLEVVNKITISGLAEGNWVMDEPELGRDPDSSESPTIKIFESPRDDYKHGGYSAVVDHVCHYALMDSHEDNGGHSTRIEPTIRMFDHVHSPPTSEVYIDQTSAFSWKQIASLINLVGDSFSATVYESQFDAYYKDVDDAVLTTGYAFDFCHPLVASRPLEQVVGDINFAVRSRSWTSVTGIVYGAYFDHVGGGAVHGLSRQEYSLLRNDVSQGVHRKPMGTDPEDWVLFQNPRTDSAGYWKTVSAEVYYEYTHGIIFDSETLYEYGVGQGDPGIFTPTGDYEIGRIDMYEDVPVSGICDEFTTRFASEKFGIVFPDGWDELTLLDKMENCPSGYNYEATSDISRMRPGDAICMRDDASEVLHTGIIHSISDWLIEFDTTYVNSNHEGDELGYFEIVPMTGKTIMGRFYYDPTINIESIGRLATREYTYALAMLPSITPLYIDCDTAFPEILYVAKTQSGHLSIIYSKELDDYFRNGPPSGSPVSNPYIYDQPPAEDNLLRFYNPGTIRASITTINATNHIVVVFDNGISIYKTVSEGLIHGFRSDSKIISEGTRPSIVSNSVVDEIHIAYYSSGTIRYARISSTGTVVEHDIHVVSVSEAQTPAIALSTATNKIVIVYNDGTDLQAATSVDGGSTWTTTA